MKVMKVIRQLILLGLALMMCQMAVAEQLGAQALMQKLSNEMIHELTAKKLLLKNDNHHEIYSIVDRVLLPHIDMDLMSKLILREAWVSASNEQRQLFKERLTNIIIGTYAKALASFTSEKVIFLPLAGGEAGKEVVMIDSYIIRQGAPRVPVSYRLHKQNGEWQAYDLIVEGVSLIKSYQSQFAAILNQGNMNTLLADMAQHNQSVGNTSPAAS